MQILNVWADDVVALDWADDDVVLDCADDDVVLDSPRDSVELHTMPPMKAAAANRLCICVSPAIGKTITPFSW
jgi:hypothetical protein